MRKFICRVLAAFALGGAALSSNAEAQTQINFRLDWSLYGVHAPFFLAQEKGYFEKEGLKVDIQEGQGSATVMQLVAQGRDQIGLIDYSTMLYGVEQGLPIVAVARVVSDMIGVISPADAPIKHPKELVGKVIAYAPSESSGIALAAYATIRFSCRVMRSSDMAIKYGSSLEMPRCKSYQPIDPCGLRMSVSRESVAFCHAPNV